MSTDSGPLAVVSQSTCAEERAGGAAPHGETPDIPPLPEATDEADARLIARCLEREEGAWDDLYAAHHRPLVEAIRALLGDAAKSGPLVDEIAARVWYALVREDARLLASFDKSRQCRLRAYIVGLARIEILRLFRAERRRQVHEWTGGIRAHAIRSESESHVAAMLSEFIETLSPSEQAFLRDHLLAEEAAPGESGPSPAAIWQRRHRIRDKLNCFLTDR